MLDGDLKNDPELWNFLQSSPPRQIPYRFRKWAKPPRERWLGIFIGMIFLPMGLLFSWVFVPWNYLDQRKIESGPSVQVIGTVIESSETDSSENETKVWQVTYRYPGPDGRLLRGKGYRTGRGWKTGEQVPVRHLRDQPELAMINGTRLDSFPLFAGFVIIFPVLGLFFLVSSTYQWGDHKYLLQQGWVSQAMVGDILKQKIEMNGNHRHKIQLIRMDDAKEITWRTYDPEQIEWCRHKQRLNESVTILYDPRKPAKLILPELWRNDNPTF